LEANKVIYKEEVRLKIKVLFNLYDNVWKDQWATTLENYGKTINRYTAYETKVESAYDTLMIELKKL